MPSLVRECWFSQVESRQLSHDSSRDRITSAIFAADHRELSLTAIFGEAPPSSVPWQWTKAHPEKTRRRDPERMRRSCATRATASRNAGTKHKSDNANAA